MRGDFGESEISGILLTDLLLMLRYSRLFSFANAVLWPDEGTAFRPPPLLLLCLV